MFERTRVARRVAAFRFEQPPIFIVGHWRSGTTFLHHLLSRDERFCYPRILDCLSPHDFFPSPVQGFFLKRLLNILPPLRPMGDVPLASHLPQEDELPMALIGAPSFYNCLFFPTQRQRIFARDVLFEDADPAGITAWQTALRYYLTKLSLLHGGKRLLLKNPAHSGRIGPLRALFPDALFVHIHRHPDEVFASTRKLYRSMWPVVALQKPDLDGLDEYILWSYQKLMARLQASLANVPEDRLVHVRYEDLVADPLRTAGAIYHRLGISDFEHALPAMTAYVASLDHQPIKSDGVTSEREADLRDRWKSQFKWLGYR